jgi:hypothetical protein
VIYFGGAPAPLQLEEQQRRLSPGGRNLDWVGLDAGLAPPWRQFVMSRSIVSDSRRRNMAASNAQLCVLPRIQLFVTSETRRLRMARGFRGYGLTGIMAAGIPLAFLLALLAVACTTSRGAPTPGLSVRPSLELGLWIQDGDETLPFQNGAGVNLAAVNVTISVDPYPLPAAPPYCFTAGCSVDNEKMNLYVTRGGQPVPDATVTLRYDMTEMTMGPYVPAVSASENGRYTAPVALLMSGEWWLRISVSAGGSDGTINMFLVRP